ncbi:MAG: UMP kinase, partial [Dehalococcoidia bacterium]
MKNDVANSRITPNAASTNTPADTAAKSGSSASSTDLKFKRVLLKLSGEAFAGDSRGLIDIPTIRGIAHQIKNLTGMGVQVSIVVGAGNIWRGATVAKNGIDRVTADYAGMLATVINALALQDLLEKEGVST